MKKIGIIFLFILTFSGLYYVWYAHYNYRFDVITEGKVYKSGTIPPEQIADYLLKYKIKTVIDFRHPGIHCFHGTGRAMLYSAIYRIEYERMLSEEVRKKTRFILNGSSFDKGKPKGDFLISYQARKEGKNSTLNMIQ